MLVVSGQLELLSKEYGVQNVAKMVGNSDFVCNKCSSRQLITCHV